jgi:hypothetical protein
LKENRGIIESKGYHSIFKMIISVVEDGFSFFILGHSEEIIVIPHIEDNKEFDIIDTIHNLADQGQGITILNDNLIKSMIIDIES